MTAASTPLAIDCLAFDRAGRDSRRRLILVDISLTIAEGEFVAVVGPSGCGKTTLLRLCAGLLAPTSGSVSIAGQKAQPENSKKAVVFQQDSLLPWRTVRDNIGLGLERHGLGRRQRRGIAEDLGKLVGLEGHELSYPHELSGGMRQRANVARALAVDPSVLLMDEPFSALDAQTRELMQQELLRIWSVGRKTVLFVTHQIDEAVYLADRVVVLSAQPGQILSEIAIDLPRPRAISVKRQEHFNKYVAHIASLIETSSPQSMQSRNDGGEHETSDGGPGGHLEHHARSMRGI